MGSILDEEEFKNLIGHLAGTLGVTPKLLGNDWRCKRDFAGPQMVDEPPLPSSSLNPGEKAGA
ncbi:MAG TPA: hypothetical protein VNW92_10550 [Polyangiaceae bacterium]|nr:hypothetical protein [Polyangiaceae bacterium]